MKKTTAGNIHATSNRIELHDTKVDDIKVYKQNDEPQTVILSGHTNVEGNIHFEQGNGRVVKSPAARINGKIIGGKLN